MNLITKWCLGTIFGLVFLNAVPINAQNPAVISAYQPIAGLKQPLQLHRTSQYFQDIGETPWNEILQAVFSENRLWSENLKTYTNMNLLTMADFRKIKYEITSVQMQYQPYRVIITINIDFSEVRNQQFGPNLKTSSLVKALIVAIVKSYSEVITFKHSTHTHIHLKGIKGDLGIPLKSKTPYSSGSPLIKKWQKELNLR